MGSYVCDYCHTVENTAYGTYSNRDKLEENYNDVPNGTSLCSACSPSVYKNGNQSRFGGRWHNRFTRRKADAEELKRSVGQYHWKETQGSKDVLSGIPPKITVAFPINTRDPYASICL